MISVKIHPKYKYTVIWQITNITKLLTICVCCKYYQNLKQTQNHPTTEKNGDSEEI